MTVSPFFGDRGLGRIFFDDTFGPRRTRPPISSKYKLLHPKIYRLIRSLEALMGNKFSLTEEKKSGLLVQQVMPLSPGADSGLKPNVDYIIKFNGHNVAKTGPEQIMELVKVSLLSLRTLSCLPTT